MQPAMIPLEFLEERRRLGHDRFDEVWEGVYHLVPSPTTAHQRIARDCLLIFAAIAKRRALHVFHDLDLQDPTTSKRTNYRQPDLSVARREVLSERGIEGHAELAIEILSPDDESRDKLPFYAKVGVREVWLIDPRNLIVEVFAGTTAITARDGTIEAPSLGLVLQLDGPVLHIRDGADMYEVDISDTI